jgi:general secretion pathway protein D
MHAARILAPALAALVICSAQRARADTKLEAGAFDQKPPPKPKPPNEKISLQLDEADLSELVKVIGEVTGKEFVLGSPKLAKVKASVYAPQKVTVAEAYQVFLAVLSANGLTVIPQNGFYKIVESQDVARQLTPLERGDLPREERYVTRIHRLAHLSAETVAQDVLSKLATKDASIIPYPPGNLLIITESAANLRRMLEVLAAIDDAGEEDKVFTRPLKYAQATLVEKQVSEILDLKKKTDAASGGLHVARVVALERPNAIVVVATKPSFERINALVDTIDLAPTSEAQVHVVMLQHAEAKKIVGPINDALGSPAAQPGAPAAKPVAGPAAVLEGPVKVSADETTNSLIVTASARDFSQIRAVIGDLDKAKRQVYIEAVILDVSTARGLDVGVSYHGGTVHQAIIGPEGAQQTTYGGWRATKSAMPQSGDLQAFALGVRGPDIPSPIPGISTIPSFGALLTALATSSGTDILSTPHIIASDNTPALIRVQLNKSLQPHAAQTSIVAGAATGVPIAGGVVGTFKPFGPKVTITPHLNDSNEVRLDVDEEISDIQSEPDVSTDPNGTISFMERQAKTALTVKDGETVVIGGLVRNRRARIESKVPILGDIPLLGLLFRTRSDQDEKSNLVLILTPHIIRDQSDMKAVLERRIQERQDLLDHETIFGDDKWSEPHDWAKTRGLLAEIRREQMGVEERRAEEAAKVHEETAAQTPTPLELAVPQGPGARPAVTPAPSAKPAVPAVIEK